MDIRETVGSFPDVTPLPGLRNAWRWSRSPGIEFNGALSSDGKRLLQLSATRDSYNEELAIAVLQFARSHESEFFTTNRHFDALGGFTPPDGYTHDTVAAVAPEVHEFYTVDDPDLTPHVTLVFPAHACEFSGKEDLREAFTRYRMMRLPHFDRQSQPFLKMRFINTKTGGRSEGTERGFAEPSRLFQELRDIEGGHSSIVEFENRHGKAWRVMWYDGWHIADWTTRSGEPRRIELDELLDFGRARLTE
ncbi:hypothetical protein [Streptomyces olivaceiscleroticus]|uniref:Uncharacterized protein n=1 Tax=Streptomyces olivaceiscleroticus TaxID=68245 RepID=A0ABN0ZT49_9ACTN